MVVGTVPRSKNTIRSAVSCASGIDLQLSLRLAWGCQHRRMRLISSYILTSLLLMALYADMCVAHNEVCRSQVYHSLQFWYLILVFSGPADAG